MDDKKIFVSWAKFELDIMALASQLKPFGFKKIVAVTKGGLIPAYFLAKELGIRIIETIGVSSYDENLKKIPARVEQVNLEVPLDATGVLIVDDLVDSGETLSVVQQWYPNSKTAVLYKKPYSPVVADFSVQEQTGWVVFPWEM